MQRPRKEQGEKTRQTIIDVTARLFEERGYAGTSLDVVAKEAETSKSSIFWHFQNKEDLLFTVVDRALSEWETRAGDAILGQPSPATRLARLLELHRQLALERPSTLRLLIGLALETADGEAEIRTRFQRIYEGYRQSAAQLIEAGKRSGEFAAEVDPERLSALILATFDGLFVQRLIDPDAVGQEAYEGLFDLVFDRLMPGKPRPEPLRRSIDS